MGKGKEERGRERKGPVIISRGPSFPLPKLTSITLSPEREARKTSDSSPPPPRGEQGCSRSVPHGKTRGRLPPAEGPRPLTAVNTPGAKRRARGKHRLPTPLPSAAGGAPLPPLSPPAARRIPAPPGSPGKLLPPRCGAGAPRQPQRGCRSRRAQRGAARRRAPGASPRNKGSQAPAERAGRRGKEAAGRGKRGGGEGEGKGGE